MVAAAMVVGGTAAAAFIAIAASLLRPGDFWRAYPLVAYLALYSVLMLIMGALLARFDNVGRERLRAASWSWCCFSEPRSASRRRDEEEDRRSRQREAQRGSEKQHQEPGRCTQLFPP